MTLIEIYDEEIWNMQAASAIEIAEAVADVLVEEGISLSQRSDIIRDHYSKSTVYIQR